VLGFVNYVISIIYGILVVFSTMSNIGFIVVLCRKERRGESDGISFPSYLCEDRLVWCESVLVLLVVLVLVLSAIEVAL